MNTVDKVLKVASNEVGYLEKSKTAYQKNHDIIYEKTAGAGSDNYTKYGKELHDIYPSVMDFPAYWCDAFVDWCFYKAYGVATAKSLLNGNFDDYTVASCQMYKSHNAIFDYPKVGDQVFFTKNGKVSGCHHTGIVYQVDNAYFYTIEGNTSNANEVVSNGGGVARKKYSIPQYKNKVLFGRPKYDVEQKSIDELAQEVLDGKWGSGAIRRANLIDAGYNYSLVQSRVNEIIKARQSKDTPEIIWDFLMEKINNPYGVAGLMGNLKAESGLNPKNLQNSCEKRLGMSDEEYVKAVDDGSYKNFVNDSCGMGLAQWTSSGRKKALYEYKGNKSIGDLTMQLNFLYHELGSSYKSVLSALKTAKSVKEASDVVLTKYERPRDQSEGTKKYRASLGQEFYDKYKG
jgi:hypothetical protein